MSLNENDLLHVLMHRDKKFDINISIRILNLQTHHVYSTLKRRRNGRFHLISTWNTRVVFVGNCDYQIYERL